MPDFLIFDLKIGFLIKNCIYAHVEISRISKLDEKLTKFPGRNLAFTIGTPQQYNKKTVKIGQGLDFLKFWGGKLWEKTRKNSEELGKA